MENILQSIVKIIIIGLYTTTHAEGNRQFLTPPLPYFQNENFYLPTFGLPYRDPQPVFYRAQNVPPSISYQNVNSYNPPRLFHQNEHYNPAQHFANPNLRYSVPQILPQKPNLYEPYKPQQNDFVPPQHIYEKTPVVQTLPVEAPPKKPGFYTTNIVVKEESHPPYYQDDYKTYHEDDYIDNYSDESPPPPEPCLSVSPYRYFETRKANPTNQKLTLCNPHFQPNFANGIYTVKMPITLLPSRFPPRVEELIERIQNYFSTYTENETPKPQNETATTAQPSTEAISFESSTQPTATTEQFKRNKTAEIEELSLEETNSKPVEIPTVKPVEIHTIKPMEIQTVKPMEIRTDKPVSEEMTQKTIVVLVEQQEPELSKMAKPETEKTEQVTTVSETTEKVNISSEEVSEVTTPQPLSTTPEPAIPSEVTTTERHEEQTPTTDVKIGSLSTAAEGKTEETTTARPTSETLLEVTDTNG